MSKSSKEIENLRELIRREEVGMMLSKRAADALAEGTSLRKHFDDQATRFGIRADEYKTKLAKLMPGKVRRKKKR